MFWGKDKSDGDKEDAPRIREEARPESPKSQIPRQKLSRNLQKLVDREDDYYDELYSPYSIDSTNTKYRYAAYVNRIRTILLSAHRYVAYTSDIGESFRPVAHPHLVRSAYAISWTYILGDVGHEGYKAYLRNRRAVIPPGEAYKDATDLNANDVMLGMATGNIAGPLSSTSGSRNESEGGEKSDPLVPWATTHIPLIDDYRMVMVKRAVFQSIASMGLPAFTIHSVVRYSGRALKNSNNTLIRTWGPIGLGLSVVPMLPYLFDEPVEHAVEWSFATICRAIEGPQAVTPSPPSRELPTDQTTPLSKVLALQEQKKRREAGGSDPSWEDFKADIQRERAERKSTGGVSGWFGFGKKEKDE